MRPTAFVPAAADPSLFKGPDAPPEIPRPSAAHFAPCGIYSVGGSKAPSKVRAEETPISLGPTCAAMTSMP